MATTTQMPKQLTAHGVKKICESKNLSDEFRDVSIVVQIADATIFPPESTKKNIKGRITLSDGVSKMICMLPDKTYNQLTAQGQDVRKYDVWVLNAGKQLLQQVQNRHVMVLKTMPQVVARHLTREIGSPQDYTKNKEKNTFRNDVDLSIGDRDSDSAAELDLAGALDGIALDSNEERKSKQQPQRRSYEQSNKLVSGGAMPSEAFMPIKALNQFSSDWVIKARVVKKGEMRNWKNARGEGTILNVDLVDREGTLIQATGFSETAQKLQETLEQDQVYTFSNGQVKLANKRYTSIKNDYCLTFDYTTIIEKCADDSHIKGDGFSFTKLESIEALVQSCTVDVIGIVLEVQSTSTMTMKDGNSRDKRALLIGDEGNVSIGVTLWGTVCEAHNYEVGQVIAFKACRVSEYNGRSLNASSDPSDVFISPKNPRALDLSRWQQKTGTVSKLKSDMRALGGAIDGGPGKQEKTLLIEELQQLVQVDDEVQSGKAFYCAIQCDITWIIVPEPGQRQMFYLACPSCKKKVIDDGTGYRCENCNKSYEDAVPTYNFSFKVQDCSGSMILGCLGEAGESILKMKANDFYTIHEDHEAVKAHTVSVSWRTMKLTLQCKQDQSGYSQDESGMPRMRYNVIRAAEDSSMMQSTNNFLLQRLEQYKAQF